MGGADTLTERVRILSKRHDNRTCGDCEQLGPTYVNCTIGSFVCTTCSGILRGLNPPHRIKSFGLSKFSLAEVEFVEQYGNENVEAKWMGKYDERCGKKLSKESPLYKTYLEDKYERKCWLDDSFKLVPKSAKAEESDKRRNKYDSSSNSGTNSSISRDGEADYQVNRNNLSTASLGGDSGFSNDDFFADFDSVNWQTFNDKGSKQAGQRTSSLIEPFQTMSFSQGEDSASKTSSLPAPQIPPQNTFVAMNSQTLPGQRKLVCSPRTGKSLS
ncbi:unnamed protein product [Oikopleura dioica]|uniref:Arf-GAP domain-containing protein n=1 Tax=Oikopleura dioica TaxID=34765 RepID=E4XE10_OIKDI|nr:unnamed protein product [Oikopleura dioica]